MLVIMMRLLPPCDQVHGILHEWCLLVSKLPREINKVNHGLSVSIKCALNSRSGSVFELLLNASDESQGIIVQMHLLKPA